MAIQEKYPHVWSVFEALGLKFPGEPIEYLPDIGKRYRFKTLLSIGWAQLNRDDPDQNDLWSMYLPPKVLVACGDGFV